jgi:hypothetical protein
MLADVLLLGTAFQQERDELQNLADRMTPDVTPGLLASWVTQVHVSIESRALLKVLSKPQTPIFL